MQEKKKLPKHVNRKVPKNKIGKKKRISNFNTIPKQNKITTTQIEKKNIVTRDEDKNWYTRTL